MCVCEPVCLTVNRSSMLTGSLYKLLYLVIRAWVSSALLSVHQALSALFCSSLSPSFPISIMQEPLGIHLRTFSITGNKTQSSHLSTFKNTTDSWHLSLLSSHKSSIKSVLSHSILSPRRVWRVAQKLHVTAKQRRMESRGLQKSGGQRLSCFGGDNLWAISAPPSECGSFFRKSARL